MEFPAVEVGRERALAAVIMAAALAVAVVERRSPVAEALRSGQPFLFEKIENGARWSAKLLPGSRRLWLVQDGPPAGLRFEELAPVDRWLLTIELSRLGKDDVRRAVVPEDAADKLLLAAAIDAPSPPDAKPPTVEVLNASGLTGLAGAATRRLRAKGADVLTSGNAAQTRARTVIYDRMGRPERADRVRDLLGCPAPDVETRVDRRRLVDVTVELGEDCAGSLGKPLAADAEKS